MALQPCSRDHRLNSNRQLTRLCLFCGTVKLRALASLAEGLLGCRSGLLHVGADPGLHLPVPVVSSHLELLHRTQHSQVDQVAKVGGVSLCKTASEWLRCLQVGGRRFGEVLSSGSVHQDLHPCRLPPGISTNPDPLSATSCLQPALAPGCAHVCVCMCVCLQVCIIHLHYFHQPFLQLTDLKTVVETHNSTITR